jgi:hypothetical protein
MFVHRCLLEVVDAVIDKIPSEIVISTKLGTIQANTCKYKQQTYAGLFQVDTLDMNLNSMR